MSSWNEAVKLVEARNLVRRFVRESLDEAEPDPTLDKPVHVQLTKRDVMQLQIAIKKTLENTKDPANAKKWANPLLKKLQAAAGVLPGTEVNEVGGMGSGNGGGEGDSPEPESEVEETY